MQRRLSNALFIALLISSLGYFGQGSLIIVKANLAQYLIASAWQQSAENTRIKPWPWADTWPIAKLEVPKYDVEQYVLANSSGESLAFGPGHLESTVKPTAYGNSMIAGHKDTHFAFVKQLQQGDLIKMTDVQGKQRDYRVTEFRVIDKDDSEWAYAQQQPYQLTLVTCYPFDAVLTGGRLRYVIRAVSESKSATDFF